MKEDRAPTTVWSVGRKDINTYARTLPGDKILVVGANHDQPDWLAGIELSRTQARTLAKRINECLDATVKRRPTKPEPEPLLDEADLTREPETNDDDSTDLRESA